MVVSAGGERILRTRTETETVCFLEPAIDAGVERWQSPEGLHREVLAAHRTTTEWQARLDMTNRTRPALRPPDVNDATRKWADDRVRELEEHLDSDVLAVLSPIGWGLEHTVRTAIEPRRDRRTDLTVVLDTMGGIVEAVNAKVPPRGPHDCRRDPSRKAGPRRAASGIS